MMACREELCVEVTVERHVPTVFVAATGDNDGKVRRILCVCVANDTAK